MVDVIRLILSLASFFHLHSSPPQPQPAHVNKSVVIVGAGSAGLAMLHVLVNLENRNYDVVLYEQRRDVGGIWLPDPQPAHPPVLPESPLYPRLYSNTPVPAMTYPGFPFPPGTPMLAHHDYIEKYHQDFVSHANLWPYIELNHNVLSAYWVGSPEEGFWEVTVADQNNGKIRRSFDHLIVANGRNHYPHIPIFPGQDEWLQHRNSPSGRRREILHSIYYRDPERFANQTVVVVGARRSGRDAASQVVVHARKVYHSVRRMAQPVAASVEIKPEIEYFTRDAIVFIDGSRAHGVDSVILGTGYNLRIPFLEDTGVISVRPNSSERDQGLTTNLRYLFPLHEHIFPLSGPFPSNALAFIGLPLRTPNCATGVAQGIYAAEVIANASLLGPREVLLEELDAYEDDLRSRGYDPYYMGHQMVEGSGFDYQDRLIDRLKKQGAIPDDGRKFADAWRREVKTYRYLNRGWRRVEDLEQGREWLRGVETEAEWADLMKRLDEWQKEWEMGQGLVFPEEMTLFDGL